MNIFVLDEDVQKCAEYHCDEHVNKMILETAQMMCTVAGKHGIVVPYKPTHPNHPCTLWIGKYQENYMWVYSLAFWLNEECKKRYNHSRDHKSWEVINKLPFPDYLPLTGGVTIQPSPFARAMKKYPHLLDETKYPSTVEAYRQFYREDKTFATWRNGEPEWFRK